MKEKYYVRGNAGGSGDPDLPLDFVFGLTFDKKLGVLTIGGPTIIRDKILEVVKEVFGVYFGREQDHGRRFSVVAKRVSVKRWIEGLEKLSGRFSVTPTEHFRRLMR